MHGSWYDPGNPVVKYSGSLKLHECEWMERETQSADLVLVMGTSLGGLHADQVATECAARAQRGASMGACIINLQQTAEDDKMCARPSCAFYTAEWPMRPFHSLPHILIACALAPAWAGRCGSAVSRTPFSSGCLMSLGCRRCHECRR